MSIVLKPQHVATATSVAAILVCGLAGLAWHHDLPVLQYMQLTAPPAVPLTLVLIVMAAAALAATRLKARWPAGALGTVVWVAALCGLLVYVRDDAFTGWVVRHAPGGRLPSPHSSIALSLLGMALTVVAVRRRMYVRVGHALSLVAMVLTTLVILAYFFGASELYTFSAGLGMSPLAAIAMLLLSFGTLSVTPRFSLVRIFYLPSEGGRMARRFLPFVFSVPVLVAAAIASVLRHGWLTTQAGLALLATCVVVVLGGVMWRYAVSVNASELRLERLVRARTRRLTETILELEEFSQALAHDVRGPLINLREFLTIIRDEHAAMLPPEGRDHLSRAIRASERLDRLTSAMLRYGELSRRPFVMAAVEMEPLIEAVANETREEVCPTADIRVVGRIPRVWADPSGLAEILRELLRNACRFARAGVPPSITISSEATRATVTLLVQDEGVGVKRQFHERIFHPFEQLARVHEHTGIGLALVRRAVTKMNGRVGVRSDGRHGSTFWIELPRPESRTVM